VEHERAGDILDADFFPGEPLREIVVELVGKFDFPVGCLDNPRRIRGSSSSNSPRSPSTETRWRWR